MTGTYSEIISITAPSSAREGEQVPISAEVMNISAYDLLFEIRLYAMRDIYEVPAPEEKIGTIEVTINSGQSQVISGTFIMPAWDTTVLVMVYRFIDHWDFDVLGTKVVSLVVAQDWTPIIGMVLVLGMVAVLIPMMKGGFK
ncbi:unnamed protein product [marine sediment metagenome]|uniref:Uncharacterized protein n=1 Tax=marine sediment metagenome TaxID=412755 RepID=X1Q9V1_9ZZZZ